MENYRQIALGYDETNEALGVAGLGARIVVPGYGGSAEPGTVAVRPVAPGYGGFGKNRARGRGTVSGYGTAPINVRVVRLPNS